VDVNSDGRVNSVYVVDTGNQLWRFNVGTAGTFDNTTGSERITGGWTATRIFSPSSPAIAQRSFNKVDVAFDQGFNAWVFFGTGDREKPEDPGTGRIYAIRDDGSGYPYNEANLFDLSSVISSNDNALTGTIVIAKKGWYANLPNTNEKSLSDVVVFNNNLFFTTFSSNIDNLCAGGGAARLYGINTGIAQAYLGYSMTAGQGGLLPDSGTVKIRSRLLAGGGIPSSPVISMSASGGARLYVGTTNSASVLSFEIDAPTVFKRLKSWKEYIDQP
jgi:Tfp pilus tip-associated adhesin PilY1